MQSHYFLTVLANNSQSHTQQFSDVIVNITVLDANDEVPMFVVSRYSASISELTPAETSILSVSAFDNDQEGVRRQSILIFAYNYTITSTEIYNDIFSPLPLTFAHTPDLQF